mmetsp:Transcript_7218/g.29422  ORF Transcript_7218/g.29422 Transcript_7218/m.29422 type:complete len:301 (-) Transcript_7218:928-1830(-)
MPADTPRADMRSALSSIRRSSSSARFCRAASSPAPSSPESSPPPSAPLFLFFLPPLAFLLPLAPFPASAAKGSTPSSTFMKKGSSKPRSAPPSAPPWGASPWGIGLPSASSYMPSPSSPPSPPRAARACSSARFALRSLRFSRFSRRYFSHTVSSALAAASSRFFMAAFATLSSRVSMTISMDLSSSMPSAMPLPPLRARAPSLANSLALALPNTFAPELSVPRSARYFCAAASLAASCSSPSSPSSSSVSARYAFRSSASMSSSSKLPFLSFLRVGSSASHVSSMFECCSARVWKFGCL